MAFVITTPPRTATAAPRNLSFWAKLGRMLRLRRQRRDLDALPAHLLDDIGIDHRRAIKEARRKPWDVPAHWRG